MVYCTPTQLENMGTMYTEACHIIPFSLGFFRESEVSWASESCWVVLSDLSIALECLCHLGFNISMFSECPFEAQFLSWEGYWSIQCHHYDVPPSHRLRPIPIHAQANCKWDKRKGIKWLLTMIWASAAAGWCLVYWPWRVYQEHNCWFDPVCGLGGSVGVQYTIGV